MVAIIFGGPSLEGVDKTKTDAIFLPAAAQGDLIRAVREHSPSAIGLLDCGLPYRSLPTWHKEILFALARGVAVVGAAAVGAHRAVELAPNGMEGVGGIYERVASGELERDDEVLCDWEETPDGIRRLTLPLVTMRDGVAAAKNAGTLSDESASSLLSLAERLFWRKRTWRALLDAAAAEGVPEEELRAFEAWLPKAPDPVKEDAEALLRRVEELACGGEESGRTFRGDSARKGDPGEASALFKSLDQRDRPVPTSNGTIRQWMIGDMVSFAHPEAEDLNGGALNRRLALLLAALWGVVPRSEELEAEEKRLRRRFKLKSDEAFAAWKKENDLDEEEMARLLEEEALLHKLHRWYMQGRIHGKNTGAVLDELKLRGGYAEWKERAARRDALLRERPEVLREERERACSTPFMTLVREHLRADGFPWHGAMLPEAIPETGLEPRDLVEELLLARAVRRILGEATIYGAGEK